VEAYLDFATVLPGMFLVYRLLCHLKVPKKVKTRTVLKGSAEKACLVVGSFMLVLPLLFPEYFFPFVWGAFAFLLEPLCARFGARSLLVEGKNGEWTTLVRLLVGGIISGGYWELCNFWSLEKWVYTVPFLSEGKFFEMPYLGFLGFPPFCVQCFVMINALYLLRGGRHWDPEAFPSHLPNGKAVRPRALPATRKAAYVLIMVAGILMSEWTYAKMKTHTVDSRSERIETILQDISPNEAAKLSKRGWRYPEQILHNWEKVRPVIRASLAERIQKRLELVSLLHMGTVNARLLEAAGVDSPKKLSRKDPDELFSQLIKVNQRLNLRDKPMVKRRVLAWINAARRQSAFY
jgi:predicted NAD-dependent protein-ADP-ribosyltransferase YbiA (DUF1768 family)